MNLVRIIFWFNFFKVSIVFKTKIRQIIVFNKLYLIKLMVITNSIKFDKSKINKIIDLIDNLK